MNSRSGLVLARRAVQRRSMATTASATPAKSSLPPLESVMLKENHDARHHAKDATSSWLKINIFLVFPALAGVAYFTGPKEIKHIAHIKEHPLEWKAIPYLRKRKNANPWGDNNLFYFPAGNPKPEAEE
ncbi:uncharacterized protein EV422DRAFT_620474 [Fimicolochytrium jonesii]|uniref:uncharacterized protein n=1 Tax=Fimicolochytrium jonesii TaxID=1396493 RepID=UPI0022FDF05B|nr:uncharacterized protein EV422DRAFT_620474 [Fimicolochytrium jonesii]KAI8820583.1 hypothetical protein EV422DRAFT_620474 [Fimicolochytrium jonesii]